MTDLDRSIREIRDLIDRSSLGERTVRMLRLRTPVEVIELIAKRTENAQARGVSPSDRHMSPHHNEEPPQGTKKEHMSKSTANSGKGWSSKEDQHLQQLAKQNTPTRVIGLKLGRTEGAVRTRASQNNVSLKPTNQSPYNRNRK